RNVVDRLVRIEFGALPARPIEIVDQVALHVEQAGLEHREQADRAGADDHHVGPDRFDMGSAFVHAGLTWGFSDPIAMRNKPGRGAVNRGRGGFGPSPTRFAPRRKGRSPRPDAARTEAPGASVRSSPAKVDQGKAAGASR